MTEKEEIKRGRVGAFHEDGPFEWFYDKIRHEVSICLPAGHKPEQYSFCAKNKIKTNT